MLVNLVLEGTPPENLFGDIALRLVVSDGIGSVSDDFNLTLASTPDAPILVRALSDWNTDDAGDFLVSGTPFSITAETDAFVDPDTDVLAFAALQSDGSALPSWLDFDGVRFSGNAPRSEAGVVEIELFATDGTDEISDIFTITLAAVNSAPVAGNDGIFEIGVINTLGLEKSLLLSNDIDFDGDALTIIAVEDGAGGEVTFDADNVYYKPFIDFEGSDQFTYTVSDGFDEAEATVSVDVINDYGETEIGGNGSDVSFGGGGSDLISGGNGSDILFGGRGSDALIGGSGQDLLFGGRGSDILQGGDGRDYLFGGQGQDSIDGGNGNDLVFGGRGTDTISGGAGNDILYGGGGVDTFNYNAGDGADQIADFRVSRTRRNSFIEGDQIGLNIEGIDSFEALIGTASQTQGGVLFDFGNGDSLFLQGTQLAALDQDQFSFY